MDEPTKKAPAKVAPATPAAGMQGKGALVASGLVAAVLAVLIGWSSHGAVVAFLNIGNGGVDYSGSHASVATGIPANVVCSPKNISAAISNGSASVTLTGSGGGTAAYQWYAPSATVFSGSGTSFTVQYSSPGTYQVVLVGDQRTDECNVVITGTAAVSNAPVVWTSLVGVSASGNNLTRTATGANWGGAGAISAQVLASGDGSVQSTIAETNTARMFGLSHGNADAGYNGIDFALYTSATGSQYRVYEDGAPSAIFGTYQTGDVMKVEVKNGVVMYSRNGTVFYTSTKTPTYPLIVDTSLNTSGATIKSVTVTGSWQ